MKIEVCVGSSCHVKGGATVISLLKDAIISRGLEDKIQLTGSTCMNRCKSNGVNLRVDGEIVEGITAANFGDFFQNKVLEKLR